MSTTTTRPSQVQCTRCEKWITLDPDTNDQTLTYWGQKLRTNRETGAVETHYYAMCKACGYASRAEAMSTSMSTD